MTYRSIDLQVSIPKTLEHGPQQNQLNQKPLLDQAQLADNAAKRTEQLRSKNTEAAPSAKLNIKDHSRRDDGSSRKRVTSGGEDAGEDENSGKTEPPVHPYKGKHIDISL